MMQGSVQLSQQIVLQQPHLWWPNGSGEQALYQAEVRVLGTRDIVVDERVVTFGIREVKLIPNEDASPSALPYTLQINGRKVYIKGWNWVPMPTKPSTC